MADSLWRQPYLIELKYADDFCLVEDSKALLPLLGHFRDMRIPERKREKALASLFKRMEQP